MSFLNIRTKNNCLENNDKMYIFSDNLFLILREQTFKL